MMQVRSIPVKVSSFISDTLGRGGETDGGEKKKIIELVHYGSGPRVLCRIIRGSRRFLDHSIPRLVAEKRQTKRPFLSTTREQRNGERDRDFCRITLSSVLRRATARAICRRCICRPAPDTRCAVKFIGFVKKRRLFLEMPPEVPLLMGKQVRVLPSPSCREEAQCTAI